MMKINDKSHFEGFLKQHENDNRLVVIEFFAEWCGPCQQIASKLKKMVEEFSDVTFAKLDVDDNDGLAEEENIQAMPTFVLYKNAKIVETVIGANENKLREAITRLK